MDRTLEATHRKHKLDLKGAGRDISTGDFVAFVQERAPAQLLALLQPRPSGVVARVVCLRHGMGHHNDGFETASFMNRDAELNQVGTAQAGRTGELLRSVGLFDEPQKLLVVISPMRRTLQTTLCVFGAATWEQATLVTPLAAETNVSSRFRAPHAIKRAVSSVQQGDHGSTAAQLRALFPSAEHPQLDFCSLELYCEQQGSRWAAGGAEEGKWWHHGHQSGVESKSVDAAARCTALKRWLHVEVAARRGVETVLLVSHGGMLRQTFGTEAFANAEFRCFDLLDTGEFRACPTLPHPLTASGDSSSF